MLPGMRTAAFLSFLLVFSCGGDGNDTQTTGGTGDGTAGGSEDELGFDDDWGDDEAPVVESHHGAIESIGISGPDTPWAEMSHEDREWYMVGKVLPIMKEVFGEHDAERWSPASYGCQTCHGADGADVEYAMPAANQYRVPQPGTPAWENMERIFPDMVTFMRDRVTPTMGTLLGIENYTCNHCHPSAG